MSPSDRADQHGWWGTLVAASLNAIGMPLDLLISRHVPGIAAWSVLASSAVGLLLVVLLVARRPASTIRFTAIVFSLNNLAILVSLWVTSGTFASASGLWIPFQANKLGTLATALLAPTLAAGLASIGGYVLMVLLKYLTFAPAIQHRLAIGEPWTIVIYGLFAAVFLVYRLHGLALERRMARLQSETAAAERLARTFLAVRDFTNTPLQTIELAAEVIRGRNPELAPIVNRIERSVDRLFRLNRAFSAYESHLKWTSDDVSPDSGPLVGAGHSLTA